MSEPRSLRVEVPVAPSPALLRPAIAQRLAGRAFPGAAEDVVAQAVAQAVADAAAARTGRSPWR
jgi:hypothetical protein